MIRRVVIAAAVYNATGVRVRELPMLLKTCHENAEERTGEIIWEIVTRVFWLCFG